MTPDAIECPSCGKRYAYKPELAGRRVKCKCGGVIAVPVPAPIEEADEGFDFSNLPESFETEQQAPAERTAPAAAPPQAAPAATPSAGNDDGDTWKWWYYIAGGVIMLPLAFWEYGRLQQLDSGEVMSLRVNRIEAVVYNLVGSTGVLVLLLIVSVVLFYFGVTKFISERQRQG